MVQPVLLGNVCLDRAKLSLVERNAIRITDLTGEVKRDGLLDVAEVLAEVRGVDLVIADPPWDEYDRRPGVAAPDLAYPLLSPEEIAAHIDAAFDCAAPGARLLMWACWPLLTPWLQSPLALDHIDLAGG